MRGPLPASALLIWGLGFGLLPAPNAPTEGEAELSKSSLERLSRRWSASPPGPGADLDWAAISLADPAAERGRRIVRPFLHTTAPERLETAARLTGADGFDDSAAAERVRRAVVGDAELSEDERRDVAAFLRVVHAAFNLNLAEQRIRAASAVERHLGTPEIARANRMLELASAELDYARDVLRERRLHPRARVDAAVAAGLNRLALRTRSTSLRALLAATADRFARRARGGLGTGLVFELREAGVAL